MNFTYMFSDTTTTVTEGVRVDVRTAWLKDRSSPQFGHFVFAYKVRITNESDEQVQLLRRQWLITDAFGQKREVSGDGVIGKQPVLEPGDFHEYISGCDFMTPMGQMKGYYYMERLDGSQLRVRIPNFTMIVPHLLN